MLMIQRQGMQSHALNDADNAAPGHAKQAVPSNDVENSLPRHAKQAPPSMMLIIRPHGMQSRPHPQGSRACKESPTLTDTDNKARRGGEMDPLTHAPLATWLALRHLLLRIE